MSTNSTNSQVTLSAKKTKKTFREERCRAMSRPEWKSLQGYAETAHARCKVHTPNSVSEIQSVISEAKKSNVSICPYGKGLSYGDIALNDKNWLIDTSRLDKVLSFDENNGILVVEPGVSLGAVISQTLPKGWVPPVSPGDHRVTVGGALSNNVHGKNSWKLGNFGDSVISFKIVTAENLHIRASREENKDIFYAAIGGHGLLGVVTEVELQLLSVPSAYIDLEVIPCKNLDQLLQVSEESKRDNDLILAWVDCLATGKDLGRGFVERAKWCPDAGYASSTEIHKSLNESKSFLGFIPYDFIWLMLRPFWGRLLLKVLNFFLYSSSYRKAGKKVRLLYTDFNFIHKKVPDLKKVYRPHGFFEFQPLIPRKHGPSAVRRVLELCQKHRCESLLCAIKSHSSDKYLMSYSGDSYSIGIDIHGGKRRSQIESFSQALFDLTNDLGGKIFLAKDHWMNSQSIQKMYPELPEFLKIKNQVDPQKTFNSDLYQRVYNISTRDT